VSATGRSTMLRSNRASFWEKEKHQVRSFPALVTHPLLLCFEFGAVSGGIFIAITGTQTTTYHRCKHIGQSKESNVGLTGGKNVIIYCSHGGFGAIA
jgi:hypothetical protein